MIFINDFLTLMDIGNKSLKLNIQPTNFRKLIAQVEKLVAMQAKLRKLDLQIIIEEDIPNLIYTEGIKIKQILLNLLSNSLKFTFNGIIRLRASLYEGENSKQYIKVVVEDSGIGMKPDELREIQSLFEKKSSEQILLKTGQCLGLNISNYLATLLCSENKGGLRVQSELNQGTRICFLIELFSQQIYKQNQILSN